MHFIKHWLFRHRAKQPKVSHLLRHCYPRPVIQNQQHGAPSSSGITDQLENVPCIKPKNSNKKIKGNPTIANQSGKAQFYLPYWRAIRVFPLCYIGWERIRAFILHCYVICFVYNHQSLSITGFFFWNFIKRCYPDVQPIVMIAIRVNGRYLSDSGVSNFNWIYST